MLLYGNIVENNARELDEEFIEYLVIFQEVFMYVSVCLQF